MDDVPEQYPVLDLVLLHLRRLWHDLGHRTQAARWLSDWVAAGLGQRRHVDHVLGRQAVRNDCGRAGWTAAAVHLNVLEGQGCQDKGRAGATTIK